MQAARGASRCGVVVLPSSVDCRGRWARDGQNFYGCLLDFANCVRKLWVETAGYFVGGANGEGGAADDRGDIAGGGDDDRLQFEVVFRATRGADVAPPFEPKTREDEPLCVWRKVGGKARHRRRSFDGRIAVGEVVIRGD